MNSLYVQLLLLSALVFGSVVAFKGFQDNFLGFILEANPCVSESGNPNLCRRYMGCAKLLPKPVMDVFDYCKNFAFPDGFGSCKDGDSLFKSEDDMSNFEECFFKNLPQYKTLDSNENKAHEKFTKCIYKYGNQCLKS